MDNFIEILETEETLDPQNWEEIRALSHTMVDDMIDYIAGIKEQKVWQPTTENVRAHFKKPLKNSPSNVGDIYSEFKNYILPFNKGNVHPRFFSWVEGGGTVFTMMAEMLAAGMNANVTIGDHAPMYVDSQVINWCKSLINYPENASGQLVTGGSVANISALNIAKNNFDEGKIKIEGLQNTKGKLLAYCSAETHNCMIKGAEVIGIGTENVRKVSVNDDFTINIEDLKNQIANDKKAGNHPFIIIGNAGTVNTGAIDDLMELHKIAQENNIWFHIDAAIGGFAKIVDEYKEPLKALELADSVALDLHKWLYIPYEIGCILIKDSAKHRYTYAPMAMPIYLSAHEKGLAAGPDPIANYGMDLSRNFKALKAWMGLQEHGIDKYRRMLRQNIAQAFYLEHLVINNQSLEMICPVTLNIVCFRYVSDFDLDLNALNKEILMQLQLEGIAAPSYTFLNEKYAIRAAITNHRSRKSDFELMTNAIVRIGKELENNPKFAKK